MQALTESCNTGFAQLGVRARRGQGQGEGPAVRLRAGRPDRRPARRGRPAGGGQPDRRHARTRTAAPTRPRWPSPRIGQNDVRMTPLQGALIAASVANDGSQMRPYLVEQLLGPDRTTSYYTAKPRELRQPVSGQVAGDLRDMMVSVVAERHRHNGRDRRLHGRRQDRHRAVRRRTRPTTAGSSASRWTRTATPVSAVCVDAGAGAAAAAAREAARIAGQIMQAAIADAGRPLTMLSPGVQLGNRYRLDERIASGGMGDVWRGTDEVLGRTVAVKILLPALLDEPGFAERFRGEARTMATINHPGVVDVYDYGSDQQHRLPGHGVRRGRRAVRDAGPGRPAHPGPDDGPGRAGRRRAARRPREGHRAPRREAGQPAGPAERHAGAHRLRHRPLRPGRPAHRGRLGARHRLVHLAGAGHRRRSPRPPPTSTRSASSPTSASPVGGPFEGDNPLEIAMRHVRETPRPLPGGHPAAGPRDRRAGDGQGPGGPLAERRRPGRRSPGRPRRPLSQQAARPAGTPARSPARPPRRPRPVGPVQAPVPPGRAPPARWPAASRRYRAVPRPAAGRAGRPPAPAPAGGSARRPARPQPPRRGDRYAVGPATSPARRRPAAGNARPQPIIASAALGRVAALARSVYYRQADARVRLGQLPAAPHAGTLRRPARCGARHPAGRAGAWSAPA